jgi:hypothetical protein
MSLLLPWKTDIVAPPASTALTRVETVKLELDIKTTEHDDLIKEWILRASAEVVRYCQREFAQATVTDHFMHGAGLSTSPGIYVSRPPVVEIVDSVQGEAPIDLSSYGINPRNGLMQIRGASGYPEWWSSYATLAMTYRGGYTLLQDLPRDLEDAVITLVKSKFFSRKRDPFIISESVPGVLSVEYRYSPLGEGGANLPADVQAVLDSYKRYTI